jgi:hypothetical protein
MIFSPQINGLLELAALISTACALTSRRRRGLAKGNYNNFTKVNPSCTKSSPAVQAAGHSFNIDRTPLSSFETDGQRFHRT